VGGGGRLKLAKNIPITISISLLDVRKEKRMSKEPNER
jgi:hypothetical protein